MVHSPSQGWDSERRPAEGLKLAARPGPMSGDAWRKWGEQVNDVIGWHVQNLRTYLPCADGRSNVAGHRRNDAQTVRRPVG